MLSVDGFWSAWDRVDWTLNFSFGDLATLIMGLGTLAVAYVAIRLQRRQNEFVEMQTQLLEKQTEIQDSLAQIEKTKFDRDEHVFKKDLRGEIMFFTLTVSMESYKGQNFDLLYKHSDRLNKIFNEEIHSLVKESFSIKNTLEYGNGGGLMSHNLSDEEKTAERNKAYEIHLSLIDAFHKLFNE